MRKFTRITKLTGFPAEAAQARSIHGKLRDLDFALDEPRRIANAVQLRLKCGAIINIYDSGTVLVQGAINSSVAKESRALLKRVLPPTTRWHCT